NIPGGDFVADALGGNVFSGATNLITSLDTGQSGEGDDVHSVYYNMGQSVVAGPTQGFNQAIRWGLNNVGGQASVDAFDNSVWSKSLGDMASDAVESTVGSGLE